MTFTSQLQNGLVILHFTAAVVGLQQDSDQHREDLDLAPRMATIVRAS